MEGETVKDSLVGVRCYLARLLKVADISWTIYGMQIT